MKLADLTEDYIASRDVSDGYADQLRHCVKMLDRYREKPTLASDLDENLVNQFLRHRREDYSHETRRSRRRMLITIWQEAADLGLAPEPNKRRIMQIKRRDKIHKAWTPDQLVVLLKQAEQLRGFYPNQMRRKLYWRSYILAAWDTGMRGCDMRSIAFSSITPDGRLSHVQNKTGKRIKKRFRKETLDAIMEHSQPKRELIWPLWGVISCWRADARKLVRKAGLHGSIGKIRHSSGTWVDIQNPGRGHEHLGNTRAVFDTNYRDHELGDADELMPPSLLSCQNEPDIPQS